MTTWSQSFPGTITSACGATDGFEVHNITGRSMRQASEASLCFACGPDGGVYHPDHVGIAHLCGLTGTAERWESGAASPSPRAVEAAMTYLRDMARLCDAAYNLFEVHEHGPIKHSHTDGDEPHRHPETGPARFELTADVRRLHYLGGGGGKGRTSKRPDGPQLPYVELTDAERTFRVVVPYRYINPDPNASLVSHGGKRDGQKPQPEWGRAAHRQTMELYVEAIRLQALGHRQALVIGPGAIPLTTNRMAATFRLDAVYEIPGWQPAFGGLP